MYIYMYVHVHVHLHVYIYTGTTCTCTCTYTLRMYISVHVHVHVCVQTSLSLPASLPLFHSVGSLSTVIRRVCHTGLCRMYSHVSQQEWKRVLMPNASHIMRGSVMGLAYLHESKCIQHIDLKGTKRVIHACIHVHVHVHNYTKYNYVVL